MADQADMGPVASGRARGALITAIVLLAVLLAVLISVFYNMLTPPGASDDSGNAAVDRELVWVRSMYGFGPSTGEQLRAPTSVAIAPNGDVYATDPAQSRVMVFRPDGTFRRLVHTGAGGTGQGEFIRPESIDVDDSGNLYIADSVGRKIIVFDEAGEFVREWAIKGQARGVSVSDDRVYVLDVGKVLVFDTAGNEVLEFGKRGVAPGEIDAYQGVVERGGFVYLADSHNKRIQAFDGKSGKVVWTVPGGDASRTGPTMTAGKADESSSTAVPGHRWDLPQDLVFDSNGRLVVADAFQFELAVVDAETGKVGETHGEFGSADGLFRYPTSVDYDARRDWFAVADTGNNRVQIVRIAGSGNPNTAVVWRALSSPYRYLIVPAVLLLLSVIGAAWAATRLANRRVPVDEEPADANDMQ